jgi:hypothetical protein
MGCSSKPKEEHPMAGPDTDAFGDMDPQDVAETVDESMSGLGGEDTDFQTFEDLPDVLDVTQADGDRDDDEALALDADEFDPDAIDDDDLEEDNELDYRAATEEREDDIDGLGPEDGFNEDKLSARDIDGLDEVRDGDLAEGGEDDVTDFQASRVSDDDLKRMGYAEDREGPARAKGD